MAGTDEIKRRLDADALKAAIDAVEELCVRFVRLYVTGAYEFAEELAVVAVNAYMEDLLRQVDEPCKDCEDQDGNDDRDKTAQA